MKNIWRLISSRTLPEIPPKISRREAPILQVRSPSPFLPKSRHFSSVSAIDSRLLDIFLKPRDEIKKDLESLDIKLDQAMVHYTLENLRMSPPKAKLCFDWVFENESKENRVLRSKTYNLMLEIYGMSANLEEFWKLNKVMEGKGYWISKDTYLKLCERLKGFKMKKDLKMLNDLFSMSTSQIIASRVRKILEKDDEKFEDICSKLEGLGVVFDSDLIADVLDQIGAETKKALVFFNWVEENPSLRINARVLNAVARVLGREDCINEFWDTLRRMRSLGFELEREIYIKVVNRFYKRKMINAAVDLFEFAMGGSEKPPTNDFSFLLRKILVSKELDMSLATKVVRIFLKAGNSGNTIKESFDAYLKSLRSVGRLAECVEVLKAMEGGGYEPDANVHGKIVVALGDAKKIDGALNYADNLRKSGIHIDLNTWSSLVQKNSYAGELEKALTCFRKMVELNGGEKVGSTFDVLVHELCQRKSVNDSFKFVKEMVVKKNVQPWHVTYKFLIEKLLSKGNLKEASSLVKLMKGHGFPPFIDPFIVYVSKSGTADDAIIFLKAMTSDEFPSTNVFIRVFEALLTEGRHQVAHDLHSLSPSCVRNHEDVLNLFYSMKPDEAASAAAL